MNSICSGRGLRFVLASMLAIVVSLLSPRMGRAQGLVVVSEAVPNPNHFAFAPLEVTSHRVAVNIADQVAVTSVEEDIHNSTGRALEGTYIFPLPAGAHIDRFSMDINGTTADAEMLDADKARAYYEEIVRKYRDPALLEYAGRGAVRIHVFPIDANGTKHIKLQYTQALQNDSGLIEYIYPLNTDKFSSRPLRDVSVTVKISGSDPIKCVYCPTHATTIRRDGDSTATVAYAERNARPDTDFKLLYSTSKTEVGANLITCKSDGDDGYFMLLASPGLNSAQKAQAKDICFVLDTSGSMADDNKLPQAIKALNFCLANLNPDDRFQVVRFSSDVEPYFTEGLVPADDAHVAKAKQFVAGLKPNGGTSLNDAVMKALSLHDAASKRPFNVVFLTDGMPTVGETNDEHILANVRAAGGNTRVFCFGIGTDVNTHLLDGIAADTRSTSTYVVGGEDIELKVSSFFGKIRQPVLTDVAVTFEGDGIRTSQVYPKAMPDLFKGESLTIFGRYTGSGPGVVKITGTVDGEKREFITDVKFAADNTEHAFVPQLWATRRVGWLLDEIRIHGENAELKNEIVQLARKYGIVTPYTAYLIIEDERRRAVPLSRQSFGEMSNDRAAFDKAEVFTRSNAAESKDEQQQTGMQAVTNAQAVDDLKSKENVQLAAADGAELTKAAPAAAASPSSPTSPAAAGAVGGYRNTTNYAQQARVVNGRAFYQNNGTWTDSKIQANSKLKQTNIKLGSDEYFALLKDHPETAQWLSLGSQVDIQIGDAVVSVR